jgi:hypothetical protein
MRILEQRSCFRCTAGWPTSRSDLLTAATCADLDHFGIPRRPATLGSIAMACHQGYSSTMAARRSAELVRSERDTASDQEVFQASAGSETSATTCSDAISVTTPTRGDYNRRLKVPCETAVRIDYTRADKHMEDEPGSFRHPWAARSFLCNTTSA